MSRTLEITVISCENLRYDRKPIKKNAFVVVRADPFNNCSTSIDTVGGSYPSWNEKLVLEMPMHERFLTLEVHYKTFSGTKVLGLARMPVSDFMGGYLPYNYLNFLSYRLRDINDERNGIINLSVKVKVPDNNLQNYHNRSKKNINDTLHGRICSTSKPTLAVPVGGMKFDSVVTGIPVDWCTNHGGMF